MGAAGFRIGVVAPGSRIEPALAAKVAAFAASRFSDAALELRFHPQCFLSAGHFAGEDDERAQAFLDMANDASLDAVWFARGGYGACRLAERVLAGVTDVARRKLYLGYSDAGMLMAGLYKAGFARLAHGPMPVDLNRPGGEAAVARALAFLVRGAADALEPTVSADAPAVAFNITVLSHLLGTPFEPDLAGHVLMLEDVGETMYRIDRALFHITSDPGMRRLAGIRLGRCAPIPANDPDFGQSEAQIAAYWCERSGIPYLGRADIGHDIGNRVVPFGRWKPPAGAD